MRVCLLRAKDGSLGAEQILRAAAWCVLYDVDKPVYLVAMPDGDTDELTIVVARNKRRDALFNPDVVPITVEDSFEAVDALCTAAAELLPFVRRALSAKCGSLMAATIDAIESVHFDREQARLIEKTEPASIRYVCTGQRYSDAVIVEAGRVGTLNFFEEPTAVTVFSPCKQYRGAFDGATKVTLPGDVDPRRVDEDVYWKMMRWRTLWWWPWGGATGAFPRWLMPTTTMK